MSMFTLRNVTYTIKTRKGSRVLVDVPTLDIPKHQFTALIGPNGAGKTTLLNLLSGDELPSDGSVQFDGRLLGDYTLSELSQKRCVLPQLQHIPFAINVLAILYMGLMPHGVSYRNEAAQKIVMEVAERLQLTNLLDQTYQVLSGGEQHRTQIGRVLVQALFELETCGEDRLLLLDEPFNHLDLYHQKHLLSYLKELQSKGVTIVCVMHDLNQALHAADQCVILKKGTVYGVYNVLELKNGQVLSEVFDIPFVELTSAQHPNAYSLSIFGHEFGVN